MVELLILMIRAGASLQEDLVAVATCAQALQASLGPNQVGLVVAPEYFCRNRLATEVSRYHLSRAERNQIIVTIANLSRWCPRVILLPGTIAWKTSLGTVRNSAYLYIAGSVVRFDKQADIGESIPGVTLFAPDERFTGNVTEIAVAGRRLRVGVEICLDHYDGALARTFQEEVDLHVVLSDVILNQKHNIRVRDGGVFVHVSTEDRLTPEFASHGTASSKYYYNFDGRLMQANGGIPAQKFKTSLVQGANVFIGPHLEIGTEAIHLARITNVFVRQGNTYRSLRASFSPTTNLNRISVLCPTR